MPQAEGTGGLPSEVNFLNSKHNTSNIPSSGHTPCRQNEVTEFDSELRSACNCITLIISKLNLISEKGSNGVPFLTARDY